MTWILACPVCRTILDANRCPGCGKTWEQVDGIWRFLPAEREAVFAPFLRDYTRIRHAEGRGSDDPEHYLRLPDCDPTHPIAWQWWMRRRTWETFRSRVLPRLGPKILDLGAGVGWLSHRVADLGYQPCAVDVSVDKRDGLAAARHYRSGWPRLQAELDHLPLADGQADAVIYNASLHYSPDYAVTLREALRVLKPGGRFAVSDVVVRGEVPESMRRNMELWIGCVAGALRDTDYLAKLQAAGFEDAAIEVTRVYSAEDAKEFLSGQTETLQQLARDVDGRFVSGFVRARKPLVAAGEASAAGEIQPAAAATSTGCGCGPRCC